MRRAARPLLYAGTVAIVLGLAKIHARFIGHYVLHSTEPSRLVWTVGYILLLMVATYGVGLPELPKTTRQAVTSSLLAPLSAAGVLSLVQLVVGDSLLPRFVIFGTVVLLVPWNLVCVGIARGGRSQGERRDRVVLVAPIGEVLTLREELAAAPERPAALVAAMTVEEASTSDERVKPLVESVVAEGGSLVVLDRSALAEPSVVAQAASLHEAGIRVRPLSSFYEEWLGKLPVSELERASLLFDIRELHGPRYVRVKRLVDIGVGIVGIVALIIVEPFVLIGNLFGNRGKLLFRQQRVGKNGKSFDVLKFRTMREDVDVPDGTWTQEDDPRITSFGRFLRRTHIDEMPQLWNIVAGDLSIVGPRPEQPRYVEELTAKLPFYSLRHLVRPGLTGWAQVKYGYAGDERDAVEKLQYDFWYLRKQSLGLDLRIVGRTLRSVAGRGGR
jgi:lipopolysaccharide/colanic/teichoic acid biosynthesis glycosyltransferase